MSGFGPIENNVEERMRIIYQIFLSGYTQKMYKTPET